MKIKDTPLIGGNEEKEIFTPAAQTQTVATSVGLPDDKDVENIERLLKNYELAHPGEIKRFVKRAKEEQDQLRNDLGSNKKALGQNGGPSFRRAITMPIGLMHMIEDGYPLMFSHPRHLHWFMKKFSQFNIAKKI